MTTFYSDDAVTLHHGDALEILRELGDGTIDCCVTSPPYFGLRDYGVPGQYGLEPTPAEYVETMRALFAEVRRVLADDGTLWLNLGDSYGRGSRAVAQVPQTIEQGRRPAATRPRDSRSLNLQPKSLVGIPWRVAFALQDDGWILRNDIIWAKPNGMPESVTDRLTNKHEHLFLLTKSPRYWFDLGPIRQQYDGDRDLARRARTGETNKENSVPTAWPPIGGTKYDGVTSRTTNEEARKPRRPDEEYQGAYLDSPHSGYRGTHENGRNPGDVWTIPTAPFTEAHFAVMPQVLASRCIQAGCKPGGVVLDPFSGSGTTGLAAGRHGRRYVGIDLNRDYLELSLKTRLAQGALIEIDEGAAS